MADFSNSNVDSRYNAHSDSEDEPYLRFIVVGKKCHQNQSLLAAMQEFDAEVEISDTGFEFMHEALEDSDTCSVFVLDNFEGDVFTRLHRSHCRIIGPTVVIKCAQNHQRLPKNSRPLYCTAMHELVLCFTGFRIKEDLSRLADLVHHMGGSIRKDISKNVTHLVANSTKGEKYSLAISFGLSIMTQEWIHQCWEQRETINLRADDETMMQYKVSPFYFCVISTYGFTKEEERDIENQVVQYGGSFVECGAPSATHLVVSSNVHELETDVHPGVHVVTDEWIWESVMLSACARESQYRWGKDQGKFKTPGTPGTPRANSATPKTMSGSKSRKRKKLKENLAQLASEGEVDTPMYKRRSSEMGHMSCGQSFLDVTPDVSSHGILQDKTLNRENSVTSTSPVGSSQKEPVKTTARWNIINELFQTEKNYVGILHTILKLFKEEIEKSDQNQRGGPILDAIEIKKIFGEIPPIYDVHMKIRDSLNELVNKEWDENCSVGDIFIRNTEQLVKAYPPFVNFFSDIKGLILNCDKTKPRFHAFLKICQSKPECGRQTLPELLIRLVQRLPSVILLLKEICKKTEASNPDKEKLEKAILSVEGVMKLINKAKGETESYQHFFERFHEIEHAPPDLLSSSRKLITTVDLVEISDVMQGRGENATIFLLSDQLEMTKRRVKARNAKSPGNHVGGRTLPYKHVVNVPFNHIKRVLNIKDTQECKNIFGLITREGQEAEKLYAFTIVDEDVNKDEFLQLICKAVAGYKFRMDHESLLATVDATTVDLQLDFTDLGTSKILGKAAARFGKRVSRAFSFKQTPRKLKRAISSMVMHSPLNRRDSTASMNSMTPGGSGLTRGNRMASCNDLADESCYMQENMKFPDFDQLSMGTPCKSYQDTISEEDKLKLLSAKEPDSISVVSLDVNITNMQNPYQEEDLHASDHINITNNQNLYQEGFLAKDQIYPIKSDNVTSRRRPHRLDCPLDSAKKVKFESAGDHYYNNNNESAKDGNDSEGLEKEEKQSEEEQLEFRENEQVEEKLETEKLLEKEEKQLDIQRLEEENQLLKKENEQEEKEELIEGTLGKEGQKEDDEQSQTDEESEEEEEWEEMGYYTWKIWKAELNENFRSKLLPTSNPDDALPLIVSDDEELSDCSLASEAVDKPNDFVFEHRNNVNKKDVKGSNNSQGNVGSSVKGEKAQEEAESHFLFCGKSSQIKSVGGSISSNNQQLRLVPKGRRSGVDSFGMHMKKDLVHKSLTDDVFEMKKEFIGKGNSKVQSSKKEVKEGRRSLFDEAQSKLRRKSSAAQTLDVPDDEFEMKVEKDKNTPTDKAHSLLIGKGNSNVQSSKKQVKEGRRSFFDEACSKLRRKSSAVQSLDLHDDFEMNIKKDKNATMNQADSLLIDNGNIQSSKKQVKEGRRSLFDEARSKLRRKSSATQSLDVPDDEFVDGKLVEFLPGKVKIKNRRETVSSTMSFDLQEDTSALNSAKKKNRLSLGLKRRSSLLGDLLGSLKSKKKRRSSISNEARKECSNEKENVNKSPRKTLDFNMSNVENFDEILHEEEQKKTDGGNSINDNFLGITTRKKVTKVRRETAAATVKNESSFSKEKPWLKRASSSYRDSPIKRMISDGTKYARQLKDKFAQYSQEDSALIESKEHTDKKVEEHEAQSNPHSSIFGNFAGDPCIDLSPTRIERKKGTRSQQLQHSRRRSKLHGTKQELDEISINSSIAPSFTSEINIASNSTTESWRRETLAGMTLDHIQESMNRIDESEMDTSGSTIISNATAATAINHQLKQERFRKPRRLSSIFSNGNSPMSSLQGTPLFPRKAATISTGTSKKYFP